MRIDTEADKFGVITATQSLARSRNGQGARQQRYPRDPRDQSFESLGGEFLHFTLYKENKDTMDAINSIARMIKVKASIFGFAGTKDRRASTVQRVSIKHQRAKNLTWLNTRLNGIRVGDFQHCKQPIQLGHLTGNLFHITLKNCIPVGGEHWPLEKRYQAIQASVEQGLLGLIKQGYINYYGLQRFGTHAVGTHHIGMMILTGDFESAIKDILHVDDKLVAQIVDNNSLDSTENRAHRDELSRARAILTWNSTHNSKNALSHMPKRFSSEYAIIEHLGRENHSRDFINALRGITRGMRMMYCHAYQSYVWNHAASYRWEKYGAKVVVGDLVLNDDSTLPFGNGDENEPSVDDEEFYTSARALTAAEVASGKYSIFDIVLPQPGFDMIYPQNDVGDFYVSFMAKEENGKLDPFDMRRAQREFSLSGSYRHLIGRFLDEPEYAIKLYSDDTEQMYPTDLDFCRQKKADIDAASQRARNLVADHWAKFNAVEGSYNKLMADSRRRKPEEQPSDRVVRTNEVWLQTSVDENNKRVKVGRSRIENELPLPRTDDASEKLTTSTAAALLDQLKSPTAVPETEATAETPATASGFVKDEALESPPLSAQTFPGFPASSISATSGIPPELLPGTQGLPAGAKGLSDEYYASAEAQKDPQAAHAADPFDMWYNSRAPDTVEQSSVPAIKSDPGAPVETQPEALPEAQQEAPTETINGIQMPVFRKVSDPLTVDDVSKLDFSAGKKIAVVLKFKLKSSNYATVVLRELQSAD
jgi:tRNA pseudouridine13 synthase